MKDNKRLTDKECHSLLKEGYRWLKPSTCCFRQEPNYLEALNKFETSAKGFRLISENEDYIEALMESAKCYHQWRLFGSEAENYSEVAKTELYFLEHFPDSFDIEYLAIAVRNASFAFLYNNMKRDSIQIYINIIDVLMTKKLFEFSCQLITYIFKGILENYTDNLIRISLEEALYKLLDIYCELRKYPEAIEQLDAYLQKQLSNMKIEKDNRKISKTYIMLGILRVLNNEEYMWDDINRKMFKIYDRSCGDDINDLDRLKKAFKEHNVDHLNYCINIVWLLFPNGMLKGWRYKFNEGDNRMKSHLRTNKKNNNNDIETVVDIAEEEDKMFNFKPKNINDNDENKWYMSKQSYNNIFGENKIQSNDFNFGQEKKKKTFTMNKFK